MKNALILYLSLCFSLVEAQTWQQAIDYEINVELNVETNRYVGKQIVKYTNHSSDTLTVIYFHLFNNAFQPGSMMSVRAQNHSDPIKSLLEIEVLKPNEIGYIHVTSVLQNEKELKTEEQGTILKVELEKAILPRKSAAFTMDFEAQAPVQIRRSGRDNSEGVRYSMAQWYPKLCAYDDQGWHADPYIGREFYGPFGHYKVAITIDSSYVLGGTGHVTNPKDVKNGYGGLIGKPETQKVTWRFEAENVHDFVWAADPEYCHKVISIMPNLNVHLLHKNNSEYNANWDSLGRVLPKLFTYVNARFGTYPFQTYSIIQAGDGGMEYPMATFIMGRQSIRGLIGVTVHELLHSWYQMVIATNEAKYPWMDEGFTTYASAITQNYLFLGDSIGTPNYSRRMRSAVYLTNHEKNEPMTIHSDHYNTNFAYGVNAYSKGTIYLHQLSYVIGQEALNQTLKRYFDTWKFKHPKPNDFLRVAEKVSGLELDWYNEYMIASTRKVDYAIERVEMYSDSTLIELTRKEDFILPVDLEITLKNNEKVTYSIPLVIMRGHKKADPYTNQINAKPWAWVNPDYTLVIPYGVAEISSIRLDPEAKTMDVDRKNNEVEMSEDALMYFQN